MIYILQKYYGWGNGCRGKMIRRRRGKTKGRTLHQKRGKTDLDPEIGNICQNILIQNMIWICIRFKTTKNSLFLSLMTCD